MVHPLAVLATGKLRLHKKEMQQRNVDEHFRREMDRFYLLAVRAKILNKFGLFLWVLKEKKGEFRNTLVLK
jgi:hypothetical protein